MKSIILSLGLLVSMVVIGWSQVPQSATQNPIDILSGEWVQKTTSIKPAPSNDSWKTETTINEFTPILGGKGLHRIAYNDHTVVEGYFFYDVGSKKLIGMSIDDNGYVWQTESMLNDKGEIIGNKGGAISDKAVRLETELDIKDVSEIHFVQHLFDGDKEILTTKGFFIRVR